MMIAKGKSWRRSNPRDVLSRLIAENPKAGKRKLLALFLEDINGSDGDGALDSVAKYWFDANYDRLAGGDGQA
jgi:hypothetical protein